MKRLASFVQVVFILTAAFGVYSFVASARDAEGRRMCAPLCHLHPTYAARNRTAPDFELPSLGQGKVRLSSFRGKVVILNFWTKNCRPCLEEMPSLGELAKALRANPSVVVLTVSTDESLEDIQGTLQSVLGTAVAPFITTVDPDAKVVREKYGTRLYPETWIIDPRGVIRARFDGPRDWSSPLIHGLVEQVGEPLACAVRFEDGEQAVGDGLSCEEI